MKTRIEAYRIVHNGKTVYGELYRPDKDIFPLVIISHGLGGCLDGSRDFAEDLQANGIGAFIFDFCGGSDQCKSDGKTTEMSILSEAADLECVLHFFRKEEFIDKDHIFLMGKSQGAYVSTLVAARRKDEIRALIGLYPGYVLQDAAKEEAEKYGELPKELDVLWLRVGRMYIEDLLKTDIYKQMERYGGEVLLIHGEADSIVPYDSVKKAMDHFKNAKLIVLPEAEHGFHGPEREKVIETVTDYVLKRI
ncbi:MAG: lysophospholipase [Erysipelotrichaceae bacterium]|nr:lysophospholipase [Erysipelotrichaceae bacterium]